MLSIILKWVHSEQEGKQRVLSEVNNVQESRQSACTNDILLPTAFFPCYNRKELPSAHPGKTPAWASAKSIGLYSSLFSILTYNTFSTYNKIPSLFAQADLIKIRVCIYYLCDDIWIQGFALNVFILFWRYFSCIFVV